MSETIFDTRRERTRRTLATLRGSLREQLGADYEALIGAHTCIYATGSCGREEMGAGSDLDAYIVRIDGQGVANSAALERAVQRANAAAELPPLDGEGKYLEMVEAKELLELLGNPADDYKGVLTKRMLLLLESRVLAGEAAHTAAIERVVGAYWQNADIIRESYLPFVLVNDIIRYWRIVLLNHEWKLRKRKDDLADDSSLDADERRARLMAERRYRSYKLRFPRCLTCFSALTHLLALTATDPAHVSLADALAMIRMTPVERIRGLPEQDLPEGMRPRVRELSEALLDAYREHLEHTDRPKAELLELLREDLVIQKAIPKQGQRFTQLMFELVSVLGQGRPLHRSMLV
ncbi:hypothetical protein PPSIR1_26518 [Plesiocystis pacifica SIR-1]|uniref:Uncharacterized protein n=1 Tax=Plesiocystis pacifica SIR-1 TaxID=391625 RepID=A6GA14_9BACT|nr:DUF294 nucleotidyltransferase-like domain-containing protein [Plesiocystis pacifica]EDM77339.1 hypothetical protein PPSIR1_26518 [Plesiocystis pacifica SIR-1]